eukprot:14277703-Ditylum_brightwellii.AAC.1
MATVLARKWGPIDAVAVVVVKLVALKMAPAAVLAAVAMVSLTPAKHLLLQLLIVVLAKRGDRSIGSCQKDGWESWQGQNAHN